MKTLHADQVYQRYGTEAPETPSGEAITHKFELAGLGQAPFHFVDVIKRVYRSCPGAPIQPGGTCAYCGNGIMYCCVIKDRNGKKFEVGNECVKKTYDAGLIKIVTDRIKVEQAKIRREKAAKKRREEFARDVQRVAAAKQTLASDQVQAALSAQPHPVAHRAAIGDTLLNYVNWLFENASVSGQLRAAVYVENAATGK